MLRLYLGCIILCFGHMPFTGQINPYGAIAPVYLAAGNLDDAVLRVIIQGAAILLTIFTTPGIFLILALMLGAWLAFWP